MSFVNTLHTRLVFGRRVRELSKELTEIIPPGSNVLDVGSGDGTISARIAGSGKDISVVGIDVLLRPTSAIPVTQFDGLNIPFEDDSFDAVMFIDVLHHTTAPPALLAEAKRVSRKYVLIKDHFRDGILAGPSLRMMDWFGNAHHGVVLPYNYLSEKEWAEVYRGIPLQLLELKKKLNLYPFPTSLIFGRGLHFIALLEVK